MTLQTLPCGFYANQLPRRVAEDRASNGLIVIFKNIIIARVGKREL